jgi:CubicO group peptidase (beta-lactamase class C family)
VAQQLPTASPESVGLSAERLQRIAAAVDASIKDQQIAGAVTMVVRHGKVAWLKPQGMLDREAGKSMPADAMFRICSMTKPITSVAVMMLYEEGKFALEDPISKYLAEFKNPRVLVKPANGGAPYTIPATREITIRDLLRHTSGLTYNWNQDLGKMYDIFLFAAGEGEPARDCLWNF